MKLLKITITIIPVLFIILLTSIIFYITFYPVQYNTGQSKELGVVFGAGINRNGEPSIALRYRLDKAFELYNSGYINKILVSGRNEEAGIMKNYLLRKGLTPELIIQDNFGDTTYVTIKNVKKYMQTNNISNGVIFISQKFHIPRIIFISKKMNIKNASYIASDPKRIKTIDELFIILRESVAFIKNMIIDNE